MRPLVALIVLNFLALIPVRGVAQISAEWDSVREAIMDYVEGFYLGDTTRLVRSVWPEVRKYGYGHREPGGPYVGLAMPYSMFMAYANGIRDGKGHTPPGAPKEIVIFDVQDQTASAKLAAWWGTDYLLLAKEGGRWMIIEVLWQTPLPR